MNEAKQEPVAWMSRTGHGTYFRESLSPELEALEFGGNKMWKPLYTSHAPVNTALLERIKELEDELMEQARANGMGGEREAALMARVERLEQAVDVALVA